MNILCELIHFKDNLAQANRAQVLVSWKNLKTLKWNTKKYTNKEQKRQDKENKGTKNKEIKQKTNSKMVNVNLKTSVITLCLKDLYVLVC